MKENIAKLLIFVLILGCISPAGGMQFDSDNKNGNNRSTYYNPSGPLTNNSAGYTGDVIKDDQYVLGPGDKIEINIFINDDQKFSDYEFTVGPEGKIFFPKIGEFVLSGKTVREAKEQIYSAVKMKFKGNIKLFFRIADPRQVKIYLTGTNDDALFLASKSYVNVYGEVAKSGRFEYLPGKRISDYISYAGGPLQRANLRLVTITQNDKKKSVDVASIIYDGNISNDIEILPGDVINVPSQFFYFNNFESFTALMFTLLGFYNTFIKK